MKKVGPVCFLVLAVLCVCLGAHAQNIATPAWLRYTADGFAGPYSCTSGTCVLGDERWYTSFTVSAGATVVSKANNGPFIIRSTGTCSIDGTISNSVNTAGGGGVLNKGDFGGGGGGGGGGVKAGSVGLTSVGDGGVPIVGAGSGGAAGGGNGGNASSPSASQYHTLLGSGTFWPVGGSTGGAGGNNGAGINGGKGGNGGGPVIFVCNTIHFTGTIDASGAAGSPAPANNTGAGGGGGGGYVILSAVNYTANTGTIKVSGGPGGNCGSFTGCGAGGAGGNGWSYIQTIK